MPDNAAEIARLREVLAAGASAVTVDGQSVTYDLAEVRRRLRELEAEDGIVKKPRAASIDLSGW